MSLDLCLPESVVDCGDAVRRMTDDEAIDALFSYGPTGCAPLPSALSAPISEWSAFGLGLSIGRRLGELTYESRDPALSMWARMLDSLFFYVDQASEAGHAQTVEMLLHGALNDGSLGWHQLPLPLRHRLEEGPPVHAWDSSCPDLSYGVDQ